jgi:hypothetical protein
MSPHELHLRWEMNKVIISTKEFINLVNRITKLEVALIQVALGDGCKKTAIKTAEESLTVEPIIFDALPPETRITVNGKTFELKDIDKEMTV